MNARKKQPVVSVCVINYNGIDTMKECFESLFAQTYSGVEIFMVDQSSPDNSIEFVEEHFPKVKIIANENTGYAGGANMSYLSTEGKYLMVMNPDTILSPEYIEKLVELLEKDEKIGAITGKILKFKGDAPEGEPDMFDTTGLLAFKNRRIVDRAQGFDDNGQFDVREEVFGVSGCIAMYRRGALKDVEVKVPGGVSNPRPGCRIEAETEVWDYDFFMYKEDVDLSWRLGLRGWKCTYYPEAIAYHRRGTKVLKRYSNRDVLKHRQSVPPLARYHSYKNQRLMQLKNEIVRDYIAAAPRLILREILTIGYLVLREPRTLASAFKLLKLMPRALSKRRQIQSSKKAKTLSHFFVGSPEEAFKSWK